VDFNLLSKMAGKYPTSVSRSLLDLSNLMLSTSPSTAKTPPF